MVSSSGPSPSGKGVLKKKEKPKRTYFIIFLMASEIESEEQVDKEKKKGDFARVVRKPQFGGAQQSKKAKSNPSPTRRLKRGR